jgi:hypothetical protein
MKLGLWRIRYFYEWLRRDGSEIGFAKAYRKHRNLLRSWDAPARMPTVAGKDGQAPFTVHVLTGEFHAHLTCFCLYSLLNHASKPLLPVVHEDGTLKEKQRDELQRVIPPVRFVTPVEGDDGVDSHFPRNRYPSLRAMRDALPLMRKLLDVHAGQRGPTLFVDSDVLFYRSPEYLLNWLSGGRKPFYMLDYQSSYGLNAAVLESVYGRQMRARVNTGFCGFFSPHIDWDRMEFWAARLLERGGVNHFSEQTLTAMTMGEMDSEIAPPKDYVISPSLAEIRNPSAVMHHYVVPSRTWYYTDAIPRFLKQVGAWR